MTNPRRGRPRTKPDVVLNSSDVSHDLIVRYERDICQKVPEVNKLPPPIRSVVARRLAYEVAALPAVAGAVRLSGRNQKGPKPSTAQAAFAATVRAFMAKYGIALREWRNGRDHCSELNEFCRQVCVACGVRWVPLSARTTRTLLVGNVGWEGDAISLNFGGPPPD